MSLIVLYSSLEVLVLDLHDHAVRHGQRLREPLAELERHALLACPDAQILPAPGAVPVSRGVAPQRA